MVAQRRSDLFHRRRRWRRKCVSRDASLAADHGLRRTPDQRAYRCQWCDFDEPRALCGRCGSDRRLHAVRARPASAGGLRRIEDEGSHGHQAEPGPSRKAGGGRRRLARSGRSRQSRSADWPARHHGGRHPRIFAADVARDDRAAVYELRRRTVRYLHASGWRADVR